MKPAQRVIHRQRGVTLLEVLVAALILGVALMALVSMWQFSFGMTVTTDDKGAAYNLARRSIEKVKETGFSNTPDGTTTLYYDAYLGNESATQSSIDRYKVVRTITSDKTGTVSGVIVPADDALRTVSVNVYLLSANQLIHQTNTYLVRSGI